MSRCAACGLPGHRYGRNEGMDRFDPMACINQLRGELERREIIVDYETAMERFKVVTGDIDGVSPGDVKSIIDAALARGDIGRTANERC